MKMRQAARRAAREFKAGRGRAWPWVGDHAAIIDAECMDQVRAAHCSGGSITTTQIMEFREAFVEEIAAQGFVQP